MSAPSRFETGPITAADWHNASWLGGVKVDTTTPNQFRLEFELATAAKWARFYVASAGCAAVLANGQTPKADLRGICKYNWRRHLCPPSPCSTQPFLAGPADVARLFCRTVPSTRTLCVWP